MVHKSNRHPPPRVPRTISSIVAVNTLLKILGDASIQRTICTLKNVDVVGHGKSELMPLVTLRDMQIFNHIEIEEN